MKNVCCLTLVLLLCLCGCSNEYSQAGLQTKISAESLSVKDNTTDLEIIFDNDTIVDVLEIWNNAVWETDITKTYCDYCFIINDSIFIHYSSEAGLFNDPNRQRHLVVTDEQRLYFNAIIKQ